MADTFLNQLTKALGSSYTIERELFGGGMSRVFVAREEALDRLVVVKVLPPDLAAGVNVERFRREIQVAAQLHHPHIVPLLSAGEHPTLLYYTMPYIEGESLKVIIERRGRLTAREVQRILADVADALAYAHDRGVVHRDIKPGNILTLGSHALITDFGVAKALNAALPTAGVATTSTGMAIGTPAYMAPEQLAGDPTADHRVDLYALGLVAYELLAGISPFAGKSPQATMAAQLTIVPQPLDRSYPDIPADIAMLISHCLQKEADDRPGDAKAILRALDAMATPSGPSLAVAAQQRPARTRTPWVVGGMAAAVALVAGGIALGRESTSSPAAASLTIAVDSPVASDMELIRPIDTVFVREESPPSPPPVSTLSRDDSLRIAAAVEERNRGIGVTTVTSQELDSAMRLARKSLFDSLGRQVASALRATENARLFLALPPANSRGRSRDSTRFLFRPPTGVRRIALGGFAPPDPSLRQVAQAIRDSLVKRIGRTGTEVLLVHRGGFRDLMATARSRRALGAVRGTFRVEGEELHVTLTVVQPTGAIDVFSERLQLDDPMSSIDQLAEHLRTLLPDSRPPRRR